MTPTEKIKIIEQFDMTDIPEKDLSNLIDRLLNERLNLVLQFERLFERKESIHYGDKFNNVSILVDDQKYVKQMLTNLIVNSKLKSIKEIEDHHLFDEFFNIFTI